MLPGSAPNRVRQQIRLIASPGAESRRAREGFFSTSAISKHSVKSRCGSRSGKIVRHAPTTPHQHGHPAESISLGRMTSSESNSTSTGFVVIGGGNMGAALVAGLLSSKWIDAGDLTIVEVVLSQRERLEERFPGVRVTGDVPSCGAALIAVKPADTAAATAAAVAAGARRIVSIAAGVSLATLEQAAGPDVAVIRVMPNTPALVGLGAAGLSAGSSARAEDVEWASSILSSVGTVEVVPEPQLDAVTGLSGSGPAYLFLVAEALIDAGVLAGLSRATADALVTQLFLGSAAMLADRRDPAGLRAMVTSPGGTTAAGVKVLEDHAVRAALQSAVMAATERSRQLGGPR